MNSEEIISYLPYGAPFLFVDKIISVDATSITGTFRFDESLDFFKGHFEKNPVTPGVILTETMAQIGVVSLGIYLVKTEGDDLQNVQIVLTSSEVDFYKVVFPNETVTVKSTQEYFRFNKLKCYIELFNEKEELVCRGKIAGMIKS
ncbi:MAG: 3-hydroxyacyl-[acyl-carrier-protein] dehydratase [Salibacteraceae bacterium]|jgi:3-hydroxyacyl-[acyl-carrier-protein] dehydratase